LKDKTLWISAAIFSRLAIHFAFTDLAIMQKIDDHHNLSGKYTSGRVVFCSECGIF
jgi:hypothetical protein